MKRQNKWRIAFVIQCYTGYGYGWEDVNEEETWKEARRSVREYRENMPQYSHRLIRRRVLNETPATA